MQAGAAIRCPHCGEQHPREARACPMTGRPMPGSLQSGQVLDGKYRIHGHIADGGMGAVYEAEHLMIGKRVAIKTLHPSLAQDNQLTARFQQEARAASAIGHEHIVDMIDMGRAPDGSVFIVMELLRGQNLADRLRSLGGKMPVGRAAHVLRQVLEALAAAHRVGIVHRDLKPENIFLIHRGMDPDFVKVVDFGISKVLGDDPNAQVAKLAATTGFVLGTPYYMAPEQARGGPVDQRADIYACGAILYQLVTGQLPYTAPNFNALMFAIASGRYAPVRQLAPEIQPEFEQIIQYAMALDPSHRYQTAEHLVQTLAPWCQPISAPAPPEPAASQSPQAAPLQPGQIDTRTPSALNAFLPPPPALGTATPVPVKPVLQARPRRSKALPITIAAGIAVGVFAGLFIIKGTGKGKAKEATPTAKPTTQAGVVASNDKPATPPSADKPADQTPPPADKPADQQAATPPPADKPADTPPPADKPADQQAATPPPADKPADKPADQTPPPPAATTAVLTFTIDPPDAAASAKITVDGKPVTGTTASVEFKGTKPLKVVVKASGYSTWEKKITSSTTTVDVKLHKRSSGTSGPGGKIEL